MGVALDVLLGDLSHWHPDAHVTDRFLSRNIRYCVPVDGQPLNESDLLYVARGSELSEVACGGSCCVNMLVVGAPACCDSLFRDSNVVIIDTDESAYAVVMRECAELLARYAECYLRISELVGRGKPLDEVASMCAGVLGKPLLVWSLTQHAVLHAGDSDPLTFLLARGGSLVSDALRDAAACAKGCFVLAPEVLGLPEDQPSLLCRCSYIKDDPIAVLITECEVGYKVGRDESVLNVVASFVQDCLKHGSSGNYVLPSGLVNQVESLLNRSVTSWQLLESSLSEYGWNLLDEYLCMVVTPEAEASLNVNYLSNTVASIGEPPSVVCVSRGGELVFVVNLSRARMNRDEAVDYIVRVCLRRHPHCTIGVSLPFSEFQDLFFYGLQAEKALELGRLLKPDDQVNHFEDYYLDFVASCCLETMSATALFPAGYNRLRNYRRARDKGSDLNAFLDHYVENDFQMKKTVSSEYCSRTTAFAKLKRIKEITEMDLDDASVRAALSIAARAVRLSKLRPR